MANDSMEAERMRTRSAWAHSLVQWW